MGIFTYDSTLTVEFDDRLLMHLQLVITGKQRRDESFSFGWVKQDGEGRTVVWIDRHIPLSFDYPTSDMPRINRQWVDELLETTYRATGLQILPEPGREPARQPDREGAPAGAPR